MRDAEAQVQTTRNSPLREVFQDPLNAAVNLIDEKAPWITPNGITIAGTLGVIATDFLIAKHPDKGAKLSVVHAALSVADALDGGLARKRAEDEGAETSNGGALLDALSDKAQEFSVSLALARKAEKKGDRTGSIIHMLSGISSDLPALFRARAEANGNIVPEGGLGTRPIRAVMGIAALALSDRPKASQVIGAATLAQNVITATKRRQAVNPESRYCIGSIEDPREIEAARQRYTALKIATLTTSAIGAGILFNKRRGSSMSQEQSVLQRVAESTGGIVTPANAIDTVAFAAAIKYAPRLDSREGVIAIASSYTSDVIDGAVARATGTTSEIGEAVDAAGDKVKTAYTAYHIARLGVASRPLLAAVALHNAANAAAVMYDRSHNESPQFTVSKPGKYSAFSNNLGIGLHTIASELDRSGHEQSAKITKRLGTAVAVGGLIAFGIPATVQYWKAARGV